MDKIQLFKYQYGSEDPDDDEALKTVELARKGTIGDGNCFFHAFVQAVSANYRKLDRKDRIAFIRKFRKELADMITDQRFREFRNVADPGLGKYGWTPAKFADTIRRAGCWVGEEVFEFMSDEFQVDVIVLYYARGRFGESTTKIVYKDEPKGKVYDRTLILLNIENTHYETVGVLRDNKFYTLFDSDDPMIIALKLEPTPKLPPADE